MSYLGKAVKISVKSYDNFRSIVGRVIKEDGRDILHVQDFSNGSVYKSLVAGVIILSERNSIVTDNNYLYHTKDNFLHRVDGPALEYRGKTYFNSRYYINGTEYHQKENFIDEVSNLSDEEQADFVLKADTFWVK